MKTAAKIKARRANIKYLLRDDFSDTLAAGSLNGARSTPGPGNRTVIDTGLRASIGAGMLSVSGASAGNNDPYIRSSIQVARAPGLVGRVKFRHTAGKRSCDTGWMSSSDGSAHVLCRTSTAESGGLMNQVGTSGLYLLDGVWYEFLPVLRSSGAFYYLNDGSGPRLFFATSSLNQATMRFGTRALAGQDLGFDIDPMSVEQIPWVPTPLASDSFTRADGAPGNTDGAGAPEAGGAGLAWSDVAGMSAIATNRLQFTSLASGTGITLVNPGKDRVAILCNVYRSAGSAGIVGQYTDTNNYVRVYHDGANVKVDRIVAGAVQNIATTAAAYVAGQQLKVFCGEIDLHVFYGDARITLYAKIGAIPHGATRHGLYTTDVTNTFANFALFDAAPQRIGKGPLMSLPRVHCFGDSRMDGFGTLTGAMMKKLAGKFVAVDNGIGGQTVAQFLPRLDYDVIQKHPPYVIIQGGVNDVKNDQAAAAIQTNLQTLYTAAHNAGIRVIAVTDTPWKNATNWTAGRQAVTAALVPWVMNTAMNVDYKVDAYTVLTDGADALQAGYDSGDHLHPNAAGYAAVANAIAAAVPFA